jgi:hypothetical protein
MFVITKDYIENYSGNDDEVVEPIDCIRVFADDYEKEVRIPLVGVEGAFNDKGGVTLKGIKQLCFTQFRLYDDDDNLYYEGYYNGLEGDEEEAFEPLDWAGAYAGCTTLRYLENGEWVEL